jgi:hypothetical protein
MPNKWEHCSRVRQKVRVNDRNSFLSAVLAKTGSAAATSQPAQSSWQMVLTCAQEVGAHWKRRIDP